MTEIITNKKIGYDYQIMEKWEAGVKLTGNEVKAVKIGQIDIKASYVDFIINPITKQPEAWLINAKITRYEKAGYSQLNYNPGRNRKLLLKRQEINSLLGKSKMAGLTLLPLSVYTTPSRLIKISIALAKGKKKYDKREAIKKRDFERNKQKLLKYH